MLKISVVIIVSIVAVSLLFGFGKNKKVKNLMEFSKLIYDYEVTTLEGKSLKMSSYKGQKLLIVNVASKCGYTPQYKDLQELHVKYGDKITILAFPSNDFLKQEPGTNEDIAKFCSMNYGVTFQLFDKKPVKKGANQQPLYTWLSTKELNGAIDSDPGWNFCKYLIDEEGKPVAFYKSKVNPLDERILNWIK